MFSWKGPAEPARNLAAQSAMRSGLSNTTPAEPMPPASATAMADSGGQAPAIGACTIGSRSP